MALTRHSVRACFLWPDLGDLLNEATPRRELWQPFVDCLRAMTAVSPPPGGAADPMLIFVRDLFSAAGDAALDHRPPDESDAGERLRRLVAGAPDSELFADSATDRFVVAYYLGQLCYVRGWLLEAAELAKRSLRALEESACIAGGSAKCLPLRVIHFLVVTLALEVNFHTRGYDALRDDDGILQGRRIYRSLTREDRKHLQGFAQIADRALLSELVLRPDKPRLVQSDEDGDHLVYNYLRHFWSPIPSLSDVENLGRELETPLSELTPEALAYEIARRLRAGLFRFRYRSWREAGEIFGDVHRELHRARGAGYRHPWLDQLYHEANLYLGRLEAQATSFARAEELVRGAQCYFDREGDEFAVNRAKRHLAEAFYRQCRWDEAEELFLEVRDESDVQGYGHDRGVAEVYLAMLRSRFGFQGEAWDFLDDANEQFREYDSLVEVLDNLFLASAIEARRCDLTGHRKESVLAARASFRLYRGVVKGIDRGTAAGKWGPEVEAFQQGVRAARLPRIAEALLELRLGELPKPKLVKRLGELARGPERENGGAGRGTDARHLLSRLLLRLVHLQRHGKSLEPSWDPAEPVEQPFRKFVPRQDLLEALESVAQPKNTPASHPSALAQRALSEIESLSLHGGLVPFLVDLSQYYVDRDCFIASLLLLHEDLDYTIGRMASEPELQQEGLDLGTLKRAFRSLTKYLVLERNFYAAPPAFEGSRSPRLWRQLSKQGGPRGRWEALWRAAIRGGHGLDYPNNAVGLGWVDKVETGSAVLRIAWLAEVDGARVTESSFEEITVPVEWVEKGHAARRKRLPIVLLGRTGELDRPSGAERGTEEWVAHRIPLDLAQSEFFEILDDGGCRPRLEAWGELIRRFVGRTRTTLKSPSVSDEEIEEQYQILARRWFADRLRESAFRAFFQEMFSSFDDTMPLTPENRQDQDLLDVELSSLMQKQYASVATMPPPP